jgi:hypothetical protein
MMDFHNRVRVERSPEFISSVLIDVENLPIWQAVDLKVRRTGSGEPGAGATYEMDRRGERRTLVVREYQPGRRLEFDTLENRPPRVNLRFDLHPVGAEATDLEAFWTVETGLPGIVEKMAAGRVRAMVEQNIHKLKELLETGRTTLPDGREVRLPER